MANCNVTLAVAFGPSEPYVSNNIKVAPAEEYSAGQYRVTTAYSQIPLTDPPTVVPFPQGEVFSFITPNKVQRYLLIPNTGSADFDDLVEVVPVIDTPGYLGDTVMTNVLNDNDSAFRERVDTIFSETVVGEVTGPVVGALINNSDDVKDALGDEMGDDTSPLAVAAGARTVAAINADTDTKDALGAEMVDDASPLAEATDDRVETRVATDLGDGGSAIGAALAAELAGGIAVTDIVFPTVAGHRGAGGAAAPDSTAYAFNLAASYPANIIGDGGDWRDDAFGGSIICHDTTIDAATTGTGAVDSLTPTQLRAAIVDSSVWFGTMYPDTKLLGTEMLSIYGGVRVLTPEPKTVGQATKLAAIIQDRHLQASVIPNTFDPAWLAPFVAIGCEDVGLNVADHMPTTPELDAWAAAGINWIFVVQPPSGTYTFTTSDITTLKADGRFKLALASLFRMAEITPLVSVLNKFDLFVTEDPIYFLHGLGSVISGGHPLAAYASLASLSRQGDPFKNPGYYPGQFGSLSDTLDTRPLNRGKFFDNRWGIHDATPAVLTVLAPWLTPPVRAAQTKLTVKLWAIFDALGSDTSRWLGLAYQPTDVRYRDTNAVNEHGPFAFIRANGTLVAGYKNAGTPSTSSSSSPVIVSAPVTLNQTLAAATTYTAAAITVTAIPSNLASGMALALPEQKFLVLTSAATAGATSVTGTIKDAAGTNAQLTDAIVAGKAMPQAVPLTIEFDTAAPNVKITRTDNAQTVTQGSASTCTVANLKYPHIERQDNAPSGTGLKVSAVAVSTVWS